MGIGRFSIGKVRQASHKADIQQKPCFVNAKPIPQAIQIHTYFS
jgi:hypothetical protein